MIFSPCNEKKSFKKRKNFRDFEDSEKKLVVEDRT